MTIMLETNICFNNLTVILDGKIGYMVKQAT